MARDANAPVLPLPLTTQFRLQNELDKLVNELCVARDEFVPDSSAGRPAVSRALRSTLHFLSHFAIIESGGLLVPLGNLLAALDALDSGAANPLFKAQRKSGRAQANATRQALKGWIVYWVELASEDDNGGHPVERLEVAYENAAKVLNEYGVRPYRGGGVCTGRTIRGWREAVHADVGGRMTARQVLNHVRSIQHVRPPEAMPVSEREVALRQILEVMLDRLGFEKTT